MEQSRDITALVFQRQELSVNRIGMGQVRVLDQKDQ